MQIDIRYADYPEHLRSDCKAFYACANEIHGCTERFEDDSTRTTHEMEECMYAIVSCIGQKYGCDTKGARRNVLVHTNTCNAAFRVKYEELMLSCHLAPGNKNASPIHAAVASSLLVSSSSPSSSSYSLSPKTFVVHEGDVDEKTSATASQEERPGVLDAGAEMTKPRLEDAGIVCINESKADTTAVAPPYVIAGLSSVSFVSAPTSAPMLSSGDNSGNSEKRRANGVRKAAPDANESDCLPLKRVRVSMARAAKRSSKQAASPIPSDDETDSDSEYTAPGMLLSLQKSSHGCESRDDGMGVRPARRPKKQVVKPLFFTEAEDAIAQRAFLCLEAWKSYPDAITGDTTVSSKNSKSHTWTRMAEHYFPHRLVTASGKTKFTKQLRNYCRRFVTTIVGPRDASAIEEGDAILRRFSTNSEQRHIKKHKKQQKKSSPSNALSENINTPFPRLLLSPAALSDPQQNMQVAVSGV